MARSKDGVNISEAIREYLRANRNVGPTEAAADISKKIGKEVPSAYVSNIKNLLKHKKGGKSGNGRRRGARAKNAARMATGMQSSTVERIVALKGLVSEIGAEDAHKLIDALS